MKQNTAAQLSALVAKLREERAELVAAIEEIDSVLERVGTPAGDALKRGPGRPRGSKNKKKAGRAAKKRTTKTTAKKRGRKKTRGPKKGGARVQGVKQALAEALTSSPQSPAELQAKVSSSLGHEVAIATQLHMLKREGVAKAVGRGQWVKG